MTPCNSRIGFRVQGRYISPVCHPHKPPAAPLNPLAYLDVCRPLKALRGFSVLIFRFVTAGSAKERIHERRKPTKALAASSIKTCPSISKP